MLIPAQVEQVSFTINITCNCMCVSQVLSSSWAFFKCWYNIHIPLVSTFKKVQEWDKECERVSYERGLTWMLPVKRAPLFLLLLIPTITKSSPDFVKAWLPSPWRCCLIAWNYLLGYLPFIREIRKFQLENQMLRAIPFNLGSFWKYGL